MSQYDQLQYQDFLKVYKFNKRKYNLIYKRMPTGNIQGYDTDYNFFNSETFSLFEIIYIKRIYFIASANEFKVESEQIKLHIYIVS